MRSPSRSGRHSSARAKAATARSISAASRTLTGLTSTPNDGATDWIAPNWPIPAVMAGSRRTAARVTPGAICLSSSSHFPLMPYSNAVKPVALPPGRARLSTKPAPTGSGTITNTIGTVRVACSNGADGRAASGQDDVRRERDQFRRVFANALGIARGPAIVDPHVAADRSSPIAAAPCRNAARRACPSGSSAASGMSTPMRRIRSACCARAASGQRPPRRRAA